MGELGLSEGAKSLLSHCVKKDIASVKNGLWRVSDVTEVSEVLRETLKAFNGGLDDASTEITNALINKIVYINKSHATNGPTNGISSSDETNGVAAAPKKLKIDHRLSIANDDNIEVTFDSIEDAIAALQRGEFVVVVDDEGRENEGDLIMIAEKATPEAITFMIRYTSGVICVPMAGDIIDYLQLPPMVVKNTESHQTAFTVSTDYRIGTTTGISAQDRCKTILALCNPSSDPSNFTRPGHIFPLRAKPNGVLERCGHTEAATDLARIAGFRPAGVICEIVNEDGTMSRRNELAAFAKYFNLKFITIEQLILYRKTHNV